MEIYASLPRLDIPYSEFWVPLLIGMTVGVLSLAVGRLVFTRKTVVAPLPTPHPNHDFDPFTHGSPSEQRKSFRRAGTLVGVYYAPTENRKETKVGWVFDRSTSGLGLVLNEDWPEKSVLALRPVDAPTTTPWIEVEIRNCRQTDDGYEVGCKFVKTPPWAVLLLFG